MNGERFKAPVSASRQRAVLNDATGWVLALLGAGLGAGGVWLALVGGSCAYIVLGIWLLITGVLLVRRRRAALGAYAGATVRAACHFSRDWDTDRWRGSVRHRLGSLRLLSRRPYSGARPWT